MFTDKGYGYRDWSYLFERSKANAEPSFLAEIIMARSSLRYEEFSEEV